MSPQASSGAAPASEETPTPEQSARRLATRFLTLAGSGVVGQAIGFAALAYVSRRIGPANLGVWGFAMALVAYFGLGANFGVTYCATRDVGQDQTSATETVGEVLALEAILGTSLYVVLILLTPVLAHRADAAAVVPIAGLTFVIGNTTLDWLLIALQRVRGVGLLRVAGQVVYGILVLLLVGHGHQGLLAYAWANVAGVTVTAAGVGVVAVRTGTVTYLRVSPLALRRRLGRSLPFGYALMVIQIYASIDTVMLGYLSTLRAVGIYTIANKLPSALIVFANSWLNVFFPFAARGLAEDRQAFTATLGKILSLSLGVVLILPVGAAFTAHALLPLLFGHQYRSAAGPFILLAGATSLTFTQTTLSNVLLADTGRTYYLWVMTASAGLILLLNFALIPPLGPTGSALATLLGEMLLTIGSWTGVRRHLGAIHLDRARLAAAGAIGAGVAGAMALTSAVGVIAQLAAGGAVVGILGWSLGFTRFVQLRSPAGL